jgi:predicted nucleotidyltransferase
MISILDESTKKILLQEIKNIFWLDLVGVLIFGSVVNWENNIYSDYDLTIVLDKYQDENIYEREKFSPILKQKLADLWIKDLFAFNFYTKTELENSALSNPFLVETMKKSYYVIFDGWNFFKNLFAKNTGIHHIDWCLWKWDFGIKWERIDFLKEQYNRLRLLNSKFSWYYNYQIEYLRFFEYLRGRWLFASRISFSTIQWNINNPQLVKEFFDLYKDYKCFQVKKLLGYSSHIPNQEFAELLLNWKDYLNSLNHYYLSIKNLLLEILHNSWIYIIDWEVSQCFIKHFSWKIDKNILQNLYDFLLKAEQILWRTWLLSFDLNFKWEFIYENWNYDYGLLIEKLKIIYNYLLKYKSDLILWNNDRILIITNDKNTLSNQIFPDSKIDFSQRDEVNNYDYVFVHNSSQTLQADYLLKTIWYLKRSIWNIIVWRGVFIWADQEVNSVNLMFSWRVCKLYQNIWYSSIEYFSN